MNFEYFPFMALKIEVDHRSIWCGPNWIKNTMNTASAKPYWFYKKDKDNYSGPELTDEEIEKYVIPVLQL